MSDRGSRRSFAFGRLLLVVLWGGSCGSQFELSLVERARTRSLARTEDVELDGTTLPALTPEIRASLDFTVPELEPESVLTFSLALRSESRVARARVRFEVTVVDQNRRVIVFRETVREERANRWHAREIDLTPWRGRAITLTLRTEPFDAEGPVPWADRVQACWGRPRLSSQGSRGSEWVRRWCPRVLCPPPAPAPRSVVFLMVDALRADYLGAYGFEGPVSPVLDRLAEESILFENAFSQAPWTKPSVASLLTSLHPTSHGVTDHQRRFWNNEDASVLRTSVLSQRASTLAESFRAAGYRTAAIVANPWLTDGFGFEQGFDTYALRKRTPLLLDEARRWIRTQSPDAPFFLYLHFMDVHGRYFALETDYRRLGESPSLGPDRRLTEAEWRALPRHLKNTRWLRAEDARWLNGWKAKYAGGIRYFDRQIEGFLDYLSVYGLLDSSILVFTSDHGQEFLEHGFWEHGAGLCVHQLHVPLWIRLPGAQGAGRRVPDVVSLVDVMPTLLSLTALGVPGPMQGTDLSGLFRGAAGGPPTGVSYSTATTNDPHLFSLRNPTHRLVWKRDEDDARLFDIVRDPDELQDIGASEHEMSQRLVHQVKVHLTEAADETLAPTDQAPVDPGLREALRSLGYLQ